MTQNWKEITSDLYSKISPTGGNLYSLIDGDFRWTKKITNIWIDFQMNDFIYNDPFYGEQSSTAPFNMTLNIENYTSPLNLSSIYELQGRTIKGKKEHRIGQFSNSLHFTAPEITFGKIKNLEIEVQLKYSLTNSDSYGMMSGSISDHIQNTGTIKTKLKVKELLVVCPTHVDLAELVMPLDSKIYDLKKIGLVNGLTSAANNPTSCYLKYINSKDN